MTSTFCGQTLCGENNNEALGICTNNGSGDERMYPKAQQQSPVMIDSNLEQQVIDWRHSIHANPELSNREYETAKMVANHLRELGLEVKTDIAHTGVVGLLKGRGDGPTVALRADMDALPVTEKPNCHLSPRLSQLIAARKCLCMPVGMTRTLRC